MQIATAKIPVNEATKQALIDATNGKCIYIVEDGQVEAVPLPAFGTLEIACQNYKIGNLSYRQTIKRK